MGTRLGTFCVSRTIECIIMFYIRFVEQRTQIRRARRLVVSTIMTAGNYEYGLFWYFMQDGSIQFECKLTGSITPGMQENKVSFIRI